MLNAQMYRMYIASPHDLMKAMRLAVRDSAEHECIGLDDFKGDVCDLPIERLYAGCSFQVNKYASCLYPHMSHIVRLRRIHGQLLTAWTVLYYMK